MKGAVDNEGTTAGENRCLETPFGLQPISVRVTGQTSPDVNYEPRAVRIGLAFLYLTDVETVLRPKVTPRGPDPGHE